jgi:hypothetical protein
MIEPPHPGETTKEDYLLPLGMSVNRRATLGPPLRYQRRVPAESPSRSTICAWPNARLAARLSAW